MLLPRFKRLHRCKSAKSTDCLDVNSGAGIKKTERVISACGGECGDDDDDEVAGSHLGVLGQVG